MKGFKGSTAFKVLRTIDGYTIEIEQDGKPVKVRLSGVDTLATVHPQKPVEAYCKEASKFTPVLLKGESVYLEFDEDKQDNYGRLLAYGWGAPVRSPRAEKSEPLSLCNPPRSRLLRKRTRSDVVRRPGGLGTGMGVVILPEVVKLCCITCLFVD